MTSSCPVNLHKIIVSQWNYVGQTVELPAISDAMAEIRRLSYARSSCIDKVLFNVNRFFNHSLCQSQRRIMFRNVHTTQKVYESLLWRHNDHGGVSSHQPRGCLLNRLFRRRSKKTSKLRVTGLCAGNSPGPVNSPHKGPVTRKIFPFDDDIMVVMRTITRPRPFPAARIFHITVTS